MQTRNIKIALVGVCVLALGAGVFAGMAVSHLPATSSTPTVPGTSAVTDELSLNPQQRDQMRVIWENVRGTAHEAQDRAQTIQKERDDAVVQLLTAEQKIKYAALSQRAAEQFAELSTKRDLAFRDGVEKTRKILNETQRIKYDQIIRDRVGAVSALPLGNVGQKAGRDAGQGAGQNAGQPSPAQ